MLNKIKKYRHKLQNVRAGTLLRQRALTGFLHKRLKGAASVLDIGSFDGFLVGSLKEKLPGLTALVVDLDRTGLKTARERGLDAVAASALELPLVDGCMDRVLCLDVVEHVAEDDRLVGEIARVLRKGGKLILTTPVEKGVSFPLMKKERVAQINRDWGHVRPGYSTAALTGLLGDRGLVVEKKSGYFNLLSRWAYRIAFLSTIPIRGSGFLFRQVIRLEPYIKIATGEHIVVAVKE